MDYLLASEDGVLPPKTSRSSRELDPGNGDFGVSEVVLHSNRSAWLLPLEVEAEIPFPLRWIPPWSPRWPISKTLSSVPNPVSIKLEGRDGTAFLFLLSRSLTVPESGAIPPEYKAGTLNFLSGITGTVPVGVEWFSITELLLGGSGVVDGSKIFHYSLSDYEKHCTCIFSPKAVSISISIAYNW